VPLTEIVEPRILISCSREESLQGFLMILWPADEACTISAGPLYRYIDDPEHFIMDVLTHEQPADFPFARTPQLTL
jgi:hypothetical protein